MKILWSILLMTLTVAAAASAQVFPYPIDVHDFIDMVNQIGRYWLQMVVLPPREEN